MRAAFQWIRHAFELAGVVQLIIAFGSSAVVGGVVAGLLRIPWSFRVIAFFGVALLVWAAVLAALQRRDRPPVSGPDGFTPDGSSIIMIAGRIRHFPYAKRAHGSDAGLPQHRASTSLLAEQLDTLLREGVDLLDDFPNAAPVAAEENNYTISLTADPSLFRRVSAFDERVRTLLLQERPSLLPDYNNGFQAHLKRTRKRQKVREADRPDNRDNAAKLREFTDEVHRTPALHLEACLEGLAAARNRLGH